MSADLRLVDRSPQRPHRQSPAELKAYVAGRIDALKKRREEEREKREAAKTSEYAERVAFYEPERARSTSRAYWTFVVAYLALVYGALRLLWPR